MTGPSLPQQSRCGVAHCPCQDGEPCHYEDHGASKAMPRLVRVEDLLSEQAVEAAARVHADWEGLPEWRESVREQARAMIEAALAAADGMTGKQETP